MSMCQRSILSVHLEGKQCLILHGLGNRYASGYRLLIRVSAYMAVGGVVAQIHGIGFQSYIFQKIADTNPCPFRTGHCSDLPLVTFCRRIVILSAVAATLQRQLVGILLKL